MRRISFYVLSGHMKCFKTPQIQTQIYLTLVIPPAEKCWWELKICRNSGHLSMLLIPETSGSCSFPLLRVFCPSVRRGCNLATAAQHRAIRDLCVNSHGRAAGSCCHSPFRSHSSAGRHLLTHIAN